MKQNNNNHTLNLLNQLKHKKFNSEINPQQYSHQLSNQPLINNISSPYAFVCSYHPTQFITNFCLNQQSSISKPLCPRCLQQHMKSHQQSSNPTACKLQACDTQIQQIKDNFIQKIISCQNLQQNVTFLNQWQSSQLQEIQSKLYQFKTSLLNQIQKQFSSLEKQLKAKWQQQAKQFNETTKLISSSINNLQEICQKSLKLIQQKKQIDSICLSVPEVEKKFAILTKLQQKMLNSAVNKMQVNFNMNKINDIASIIKNSLQIKMNKITGFEIDKILKQLQQKGNNNEQNEQNSTLNKLQKLFQVKSSGKLHTINANLLQKQQLRSKQTQINNSHKNNNQDNTKQRVLNKLNDTTNKLKSSLNGFTKINKSKLYT